MRTGKNAGKIIIQEYCNMLIRSNRAIAFFQFILRMRISAIAIYPFIFVHSSTYVDDRLLNHERIHLRQQIEMLIIPFYIAYLYEFYKKGYYNVSFEKEAYGNEHDKNYLKNRKIFSFRKYY
jgi:hypothetical protein